MRRWRKYIPIIFVLILAVLIFQSFVLFYFVNSYSVSQRNKGSIFPKESQSPVTYVSDDKKKPSILLAVKPMSLTEVTKDTETVTQYEYIPQQWDVGGSSDYEPPKYIPKEDIATDSITRPEMTQDDEPQTLENFNTITDQLLYEILIAITINRYISIFAFCCVLVGLFLKSFNGFFR